MNLHPTSSHWLRLGASISLVIVVVVARHDDRWIQLAGAQELDHLRAERQRLSAYDAAAVNSARMATEQLPDNADVKRTWPSGWIQSDLPADRDGRKIWQLSSTQSPDWPTCVQVITTLASTPGVRILDLEVRSRGTLTQREIAAVTIRFAQPNATPSRRSSSFVTGLSSAPTPAKSPAIGSGASLRRPTASAEPPASGPAFAPSRPDPRGPRAGPVSTNPQHPKS